MSFIKKIKFDLDNRFLIGQGDTKLFVLNLKSNIESIYEIEIDRYDKIFSFVFKSKSETDYELFVACKLKYQRQQIEVYDIVSQHQKNRVSA